MAIVPSGVSVPAQSKELDNTTVTTAYGLVYRQVVTLADPETPTNYQRVGSNGAYVDVRNVVALPLPTGASTSALQTTGNASLSSVDTKLTTTNSTLATIDTDTGSISTSVSSIDTKTPALVTGRVPVDGSGVTQPVSAASLPLPSGASTSALQTSGNASLTSIDTKATKGQLSLTNNSTTPLNAGATFTGTAEQNAYPDVYVSCITDQAGTLYFDFSNDGTNWNVFPPAGFTLVAGVHEAHKALKAGRYFRVRVVNTSGSNQTYLRLYTYFGQFDQLTSPLNFTPNNDTDAITTKSVLVGETDGGAFKFVGVSPQGNLEVSIKDPTSVFGEVITAELTPVIQADFVYGLNSNLFSSTLTGSGTATSTNRMGIASTTANASSSALIQTQRRAKYRAGEGLLARFTAQFTTGAANSTQLAGMRNADIDGWFIGYNGTSFGIMYRRNSVDTWIAQASFNKDKLDGTGSSGITLDPTKINIFQLSIGYLGVRGCTFSIMHPTTGSWVLFHDYILTGTTSDQTQSINPTMTFGIQATNTSNNTNIVVKNGSVGVFIIGARERIGSTYGVNNFKSVATTDTNIVTIRNNTTINGVANQSQIRIRSLSVATAAGVPVVFKLIKNTALGGVPSYTNIDATNSCAAFDVAGTTVTGGNVQFNTTVGANGNVFVDLTEFDIFLAPSDTLTCTAATISGGAANQVVAINWNEDI